ncbi:hypothetical protein GUJ93_ZPchr0001g32316 [Zizania palustris]|uniref:Uncharacterized protein n=1 Tax=Zizania palustris TaxID=103762 RepID=A0A8J5V9T7_ZIZPA|nr:hypothetical protein GUJ93_ZPchr0001g32316 [Zizania palustris]
MPATTVAGADDIHGNDRSTTMIVLSHFPHCVPFPPPRRLHSLLHLFGLAPLPGRRLALPHRRLHLAPPPLPCRRLALACHLHPTSDSPRPCLPATTSTSPRHLRPADCRLAPPCHLCLTTASPWPAPPPGHNPITAHQKNPSTAFYL